MAILPIVTYNDPILRETTNEVEENSDELQELIDNMLETMYNSDGVGLAAPQVGEKHRLFVMDSDPMLEEDDVKYGPMVFINPVILEKKGNKVPMDEGCLSIPEVSDKVFRPETITIEYFDRDFNKMRLEANGWTSRIIQHEYDHLDGVLFIDYLSTFKRRMHKKELEAINSGEKKVKYPVAAKD
ncbi:peptide deformylase [Balneola sp. MJW-20]|uniref:peptide deformylase n=1 Tax=Gracilimonas aurantiaca TaxID=3234185 RepID=UPI0034658F14